MSETIKPNSVASLPESSGITNMREVLYRQKLAVETDLDPDIDEIGRGVAYRLYAAEGKIEAIIHALIHGDTDKLHIYQADVTAKDLTRAQPAFPGQATGTNKTN